MPGPSLEQRLSVRQCPKGAPVFFQSWNRLLFLHWKWDPDEIQETLPRGLQVDTHESSAYVGLVPFFMNRIRPRFCPALPWISYFMELNVRTYVFDQHGTPGVYFYSLDTNRWIASALARAFFFLNYQYARMSARHLENLRTRYFCQRYPAELNPGMEYDYGPVGEVRLAEPGSLEFFLVERYALFSMEPGNGRIRQGRVWHEPYEICEAEVLKFDAGIIGKNSNGLIAPTRPPDSVLFSPGVDVKVFGLGD